jgi:hypothetical protein
MTKNVQMDKKSWIIILAAILIATYIAFIVQPIHGESNELLITYGISNWILSDVFNGEIVWSDFAEYSQVKTIKIYKTNYWWIFLFNAEAMAWEKEGVFSYSPLNLEDILSHEHNSESIFRFRYQNEYFKVVFSIPKYENGTYKYPNFEETWLAEQPEINFLIEIWS